MLEISTHKVAQVILMARELGRAEGELRAFELGQCRRVAEYRGDRVLRSREAGTGHSLRRRRQVIVQVIAIGAGLYS